MRHNYIWSRLRQPRTYFNLCSQLGQFILIHFLGPVYLDLEVSCQALSHDEHVTCNEGKTQVIVRIISYCNRIFGDIIFSFCPIKFKLTSIISTF